MVTPATYTGPFAPFLRKLQAQDNLAVAGQSVSTLFDSLLTELNTIAPAVGQVALATGVQLGLPNIQILSEIERQLFLQFLESEITYLRGHRILKARDLARKVEHDRQICERKQTQMSAALMRMFAVQGIDQAFYSTLQAQRFQTLTTFVAMKMQSHEGIYLATVDDFLDNRETGMVRRILQATLEDYGDSPNFNAHSAWLDLKNRWAAWGSKHHERIAAFKQFWAASGGGRGPAENPQAFKVISDYYRRLYADLETGGFARVMMEFQNNPLFKTDPWS